MTSYTSHFRLPIPDFNEEPWHATLEASIRAVDTALYEAILVQSVANWANNTVYAIGSITIDALTGLLWTCGAAHTSSASPTTFAADRLAHPTYWNTVANVPQQRGTWLTATSYTAGDFVIDSNRYAVCLISHVSSVFNTDLVAAKWSVLIDLSTIGVGMNSDAEGTVASAATTNIGASTPTRLFITGTTGITSFGVVANVLKIIRYQGILTITHHATDLILFGATNRTTAAGDIQWLSSNSTGKWRELMYNRADGSPVAVPDGTESAKGSVRLATNAQTTAGTSTTLATHPQGVKTVVDAAIASVLSTIRDGVSSSLDTLAEIATAIGLLAPKANPSFVGFVNSAQTIIIADTAQGVFFQGGTTAQRNGTPSAGDQRFNTTFNRMEFYNGTAWYILGKDPTIQEFLSGSGTCTPTAGVIRWEVEMCGPGGGGGHNSITTGNGSASANNTDFGSWTAIKGALGADGNTTSGGAGGSGGGNGTGTQIARIAGGNGYPGHDSTVTAPGGAGGENPFAGGGKGVRAAAGGTARANTGAGGAGAGVSNAKSGNGGGAGEYVKFIVNNPGATAYLVGTGGVGAASGGAGANGVIRVKEFYN